MSVGNDVVDLGDPEARLDGLHPRWADRVFTAAERRALDLSPAPARHRLHWALWAAKESAYKASKRLDPRAVFSPRAFEVELLAPLLIGTCRGCVRHRGETLALEVRHEAEFVHAVAIAPAVTTRGSAAVLVARVERARGEPGSDVRAAATAALAEALGADAFGLRITGLPPVARLEAAELSVDVSLSHHGRFVAFAFVRPGESPAHSGQRGAESRGVSPARP